jgi:hypothetical protein
MTIFDVVKDCKALEVLIDEECDPETGELRNLTDDEKADFLGWINENKQNLQTKFDNIYKVYRNKTACPCPADCFSHPRLSTKPLRKAACMRKAIRWTRAGCFTGMKKANSY